VQRQAPVSATLRALALASQAHRWDDLAEDIRRAQNGAWSMACEGTVCELLASIRVVGAVRPGHIPWPLLAGGVYAAVLDLAEIPYDPTEWQAWEARMRPHGGTIADCLATYSDTRAAIRAAADWLIEGAATWEADFAEPARCTDPTEETS
jgi:hypothetical protein